MFHLALSPLGKDFHLIIRTGDSDENSREKGAESRKDARDRKDNVEDSEEEFEDEVKFQNITQYHTTGIVRDILNEF